MADFSKLRVAVYQRRLRQGKPGEAMHAISDACERAASQGAQVLVTSSMGIEGAPCVFACGEARLGTVAGGKAFELSCESDTFLIGIGQAVEGCAFAVVDDRRPWHYDDIPAAKPELGVSSIVVRPVGQMNEGKDVCVFDGGSAVYAADGSAICRLRDDFCEDFEIVSFADGGRVEGPCDKKLMTALVAGIRAFDEDVLGQVPWIIGLSGGLDSSVVATLLARALGPERVRAYNLATRFNSDATKSTASSLAEALGLKLRAGSIEQLVAATGDVLEGYGYGSDAYAGLVLENAQARIRGHLLSTFAAIEGGVVVNNGNRVECALGYATLYGDAIGALSPIADLTKVKLFDLARDLNAAYGREVVPGALLPVETDEGFTWQTMPSAELSDGQVDPMKWFYHDWLVEKLLATPDLDANACAVMEMYRNGSLMDEAGKWVRFYGLDDPAAFIADLKWFVKGMRRATFKRLQAPPALRVSKLAHIADVQAPFELSERFSELEAAILN